MKKNIALAGLIVSIVVVLIFGFENILAPVQLYMFFWNSNQSVTIVVFIAALFGFSAGVFGTFYYLARTSMAEEPQEDVSEEINTDPEVPSTDAGATKADDTDDVLTPGQEEEREDAFSGKEEK